MKMFGLLVVFLLLVAGALQAASLRPLLASERAFYGATHEIAVSYADLDETTVNTAEVVSFAVPAKTAIRGVLLVVDEAFTGPTNYHYTLTAAIGSDVSATAFFDAAQLSGVATNAWLAWSEKDGVIYDDAASTGLRVAFTPNTQNATGQASAGRLRVLLRMIGL